MDHAKNRTWIQWGLQAVLTVAALQQPLAEALTARLRWCDVQWINEQTLLSEIGSDG